MGAEVSEYVPPREVELFSEPLPAHDGLCWPVCEVGVGGMPHETGATPKRGEFVWGESGGAPADAVWVKVTDLGRLKDGGSDAFLWACLYDGRLFLHLGASAPAGGSGELPEAGEGFVGASDAAGVLEGDGTGRHAGPDAYICSMDERDAYLKIKDRATGLSKWRADLTWDVLAGVYYRTASTPGQYGYPHEYATVYVVTSGNVVCFYTARGQAGDGKNWAAFGSVVCQYGFDPHDEDDGVIGGVQEVLGGVVPASMQGIAILMPPFGIMPLPWQGEDAEDAVFPDDDKSKEMDCGTLNCMVTDDVAGLPFGNASFLPDPGVYFCPRLHFMAAMAPSEVPHAGLNVEQVQAVLYGGEDYFPTSGGIYHLPAVGGVPSGVPVVPGFNLLFNPWSVEGLGLHKRSTSDFARVDARELLPPAPGAEWVSVAAATLDGPAGPVYLDIAGADADGVLLTASGSTEIFD